MSVRPYGDVSDALFDAWCSSEPMKVHQLLTSIPVPGDLALRSRYDTLIDLHRSPTSTATLTRSRWDEQIALMRAGDTAVQASNQVAGIEAFENLRDSHRDGEHPLPLIEAATGLGDLARQRDDIDASLRHYTDAMNLARHHGCEFARVRVGLGLGYSQLNQASASAALTSFQIAIDLARQRDWRLDLANALLGAGECFNRLRNPIQSFKHLLEALKVFEDLNSREGVANTTVQLGEVCRRMQWTDDAHGWYTTAVNAVGDHGLSVTRANALDGLAEIEVEMGRYMSARRHLGQAARVSIPSYPRGYAHALAGLARCSFAEGHYLSALRRFSHARDAYVTLEVYTAAAASCTGIGRCAELLDESSLVLEARLDAVRMVERTRAAQVRHADQAEYFDRFGDYYFTALRAALTCGSISAFVAVFEAIAGRRLAGLLHTGAGADTAALLAQLARLNAEARHTPIEDVDRGRCVARALSRVALSATLPGMGRTAIDDVMAEAYQPFTTEGATELYESAVAGRAITVLLAEDEHRGHIVWLAKFSDSATPHGGVFAIPEKTTVLLADLRDRGLSAAATPPDVAPLRHLLPTELLDLLPRHASNEDPVLTLIPAGRLWHVPWVGVPIISAPSNASPDNHPDVGPESNVSNNSDNNTDDLGVPDDDHVRFLGELIPLTVSPTLAYAGRNAQQPPPAVPDTGLRRISWWRSTQVINHSAQALAHATPGPNQEIRQLISGTQARQALLGGHDDLTVLLAHGRPTPGTVHYIDLDDAVPVTPADLLDATPPKQLILIACWGATSPQTRHGDPLSVVAVALARGTQSAAATNSELLDDPLASAFVNLFLDAALKQPLPQALQTSTKRFLARPDVRRGYLSRWAPLIVIGY